jgi:hypothetical protein
LQGVLRIFIRLVWSGLLSRATLLVLSSFVKPALSTLVPVGGYPFLCPFVLRRILLFQAVWRTMPSRTYRSFAAPMGERSRQANEVVVKLNAGWWSSASTVSGRGHWGLTGDCGQVRDQWNACM